MKKKKYDGNIYKFRKNSIDKTRRKYTPTYQYVLDSILRYKKYHNSLQKAMNFEEQNITEFDNELLIIMESTAIDLGLKKEKIYTQHSFNKNVKKVFQKKRKLDQPLKIIEIYNMIENKNYKDLRLLALDKPKDFLKGIYLYTICED